MQAAVGPDTPIWSEMLDKVATFNIYGDCEDILAVAENPIVLEYLV